jgi:ParB family chromosome partitioning protein
VSEQSGGGAGARKGLASRKPGMGRGLAAILSEATAPPSSGDLRELPIGQVKPNPNQPRRHFDPEALAALTDSVKTSGIIQPLLVRPLPDGGYELIAGERRLRAAREAGLERVPVVIRDPSEEERLQQALIENMVREDLNPVEEARACEALVRDLGLSKQELARRVGRSRPALSNLIRILELPDEVLELIESGQLSEGHGRAILAAEDHERRRQLARRAVAEEWSVRRTEQEASGQPPAAATKPGSTKPKTRLSAEEEEALERVSAALERSLGHEVRVRIKGEELAAELRFDDVDEALALADRLSARQRR